jgi:uncharacterized protein
MTPEERELVTDLFKRLAELERNPRDPDAERAIREGLARAPNAVYALVQTVLLQDEALKVADQRIAELEDALAQAQAGDRRSGSFLDNMRDSLLGREQPRGSVPPVRGGDAPMGAPPGYGRDRDPWGRGSDRPMAEGPAYGSPMGGPGGPMGGPMPGGQGGGGSFLGTAAAVAAGAIGGGLLMNGIRGMLGGQGGKGPFSGAFDQLSGGGQPAGGRSPWDSGAGGELSRDAGLGDIGQGRRASFGDAAQSERAGVADVAQNEGAQDQTAQNAQAEYEEDDDSADDSDDGSFDDDTDTA